MPELTELEARVYDSGCRMIPHVTHDEREYERSRAQYEFCRELIRADRRFMPPSGRVAILDLGCGVGHGSVLLSTLPDSHVLGIDLSPDAIQYARQHYQRNNVTYAARDILDLVRRMDEFDYVVSIGVIEHIEDGFTLLSELRFRNRMVVSVPYNEPPGRNANHCLHSIAEGNFTHFQAVEFFYADWDGRIYDTPYLQPSPLTLISVISRTRMPACPPLPQVERYRHGWVRHVARTVSTRLDWWFHSGQDGR
jgi:SAM-dependent methyltransferase